MEPSILCTQDVQNHLNTLSEATEKTKIAGFLVGNVVDNQFFIYKALVDSRFATYLETHSTKNFSFDIIKNVERKLGGGLYVIGYFGNSSLSDKDQEYLNNGFEDHLFKPHISLLYFSLNSIPTMEVIKADSIMISVDLSMHINHKSIGSLSVESFLKEYCMSLTDSLLIERNDKLIHQTISLQEEEQGKWHLYILHNSQKQMNGVAHLHLPLQFIVYDKECIADVKRSIAECCYRSLVQSLHISVVSGCRIEQCELEWHQLAIHKKENTNRVVYYWHDPAKTSFSRVLFPAMFILWIIYLYLRLH